MTESSDIQDYAVCDVASTLYKEMPLHITVRNNASKINYNSAVYVHEDSIEDIPANQPELVQAAAEFTEVLSSVMQAICYSLDQSNIIGSKIKESPLYTAAQRIQNIMPEAVWVQQFNKRLELITKDD